jgi:ADP-heptose:LPS heptosyltransferase
MNLIQNIIKENLNSSIYIDISGINNTIAVNCSLLEYVKLIGMMDKVFTVESLCQHVASYYQIDCKVFPGGGEPNYFIAPGNISLFNNNLKCFPCYNNDNLKCKNECFIDEL